MCPLTRFAPNTRFQRGRMRRLHLHLLASILLILAIGTLRAREIPDLLGKPKEVAGTRPEGRTAEAFSSDEVPAHAPQPQPNHRSSKLPRRESLLPGAMRKRFYLPEENSCWAARWIHPDDEESALIPVWVDREGNGHFLLRATIVLGEDRPFLIQAPRVSAYQVLSLFREPGGGFRPVASEVWIELPGQTGGTERRWTGKGAWHGAEPLTRPRNVFSPFVPALREADDPTIRTLAAFRWPDVVLVRLRGNPPTGQELEESEPTNVGLE